MELIQEHGDYGWRWYRTEDSSKVYASVTTVLDIINNPKLNVWFKNTNAKDIEYVSKTATDYGTLGHSLIEDTLSGKDVLIPDTHKVLLDRFLEWKEEVKLKPLHLEKRVYSDAYGFAGTVDFIGELNGEPMILDWKFSKSYDIKYGYQLAAYRLAAKEMNLGNYTTMCVQFNKITNKIETYKYQHFEHLEDSFLIAFELWKRYNFSKLIKLGWDRIEQNIFQRRELCAPE